ncbi:MAG: STAS domain-containing protein [Nitrospirota bacterium]|nr:MAG: STAS domain-containing protein [Nitrospirota bacterium]
MRLSVDKSGKKGVLRPKGELTLLRADEMKKALMRALKKVKQLEIDLAGADDLDAACLQLICSAHRSAINAKRKITLKDTVPASVKDRLVFYGYVDAKCDIKGQNDCLLASGGNNV